MSLHTFHYHRMHWCYQKQHMVTSAVLKGEGGRGSVGNAKIKRKQQIAEELVKNMEMPKGLQGEWGGPRRDAPCWGLGGYFNTTWAPVSHVAEQHTKLI